MERKLQTGDELQDFYFNPTSKTVCDKMYIRPGRARIFFNQTKYNKPFGTKLTGLKGTKTEIAICAGAMSGLTMTAGALALLSGALF